MKPHIRCSALPRIFHCTESAKTPGIWIDCESEIARVGTAAHIAFAEALQDKEPDFAMLASDYRIEERELLFLHHSAMRKWREMEEALEIVAIEQQAESDMGSLVLTGKADLVCRVKENDEIIVIDLKTGYKESDYTKQLVGYALLNGATKVVTLFSRLRVHEVLDVTPEMIEDFEEELCNIVAGHGSKFVPSNHCSYCPREHECPAKATLIQTAGKDMLAALQISQGLELSLAQMANLYPQYQLLDRVLGAYKEQVKELVLQEGSITLEDGRVLTTKDVPRTSIDYRPDILRNHLTEEEIAGCVSITKTKLTEAVCASKPKGKKTEAKNELFAELEEAGALKVKMTKSLELKKGVK